MWNQDASKVSHAALSNKICHRIIVYDILVLCWLRKSIYQQSKSWLEHHSNCFIVGYFYHQRGHSKMKTKISWRPLYFTIYKEWCYHAESIQGNFKPLSIVFLGEYIHQNENKLNKCHGTGMYYVETSIYATSVLYDITIKWHVYPEKKLDKTYLKASMNIISCLSYELHWHLLTW